MSILLKAGYKGYLSGDVVTIDDPTEAALIAQGLAETSTAAPYTGARLLVDLPRGRTGVPAGSSAITITNNLARQTSAILAVINQATADSTATSVQRVSTSNGSFTITVNANATAVTAVDWVIFNTGGLVSR